MSDRVDTLLQTALALPDAEQLQLVAALNSSLDERGLRPLDEAWLAEIQRRSSEFDAGAATPIVWTDVQQRARREIMSRS